MSGVQELIRARAHELWQRAGCPQGRADEFWFAAERELENRTASADGEAGILVPLVDQPPADAFSLEGPMEGPAGAAASIIH